MKVSKAKLAFLSVLAAGIIGLAASMALGPSQTYGLETDEAGTSASAANPGSSSGASAQGATAGTGGATGSEALPPQAPIDSPTSGVGAGATQLPSAGSGGYLSQESVSWAQILLFGVLAVTGSGSLVWAFGRSRR